ncbi:MAG: gamma-glutamyltransferase family protein [Negativicutes bacterium]|nr:gamma-glutamyltransferase family protein [Negativicutes bacterium]
MNFDPHYLPYPSRRQVTYGRRGMVCTSQPLAAQIGLDVLKAGGNAIDAAIATAAALTVVEPTGNGIGGDAFALVWIAKEKKLHGLNASGAAPALMTEENIRAKGVDAIPQYGLIPITVPGIPSAWAALSEKYGKLPLTEVLSRVIKYAEEGFPVHPTASRYWKRGGGIFAKERQTQGEVFKGWFDTFAPDGTLPEPGDVMKLPGHAATLREIAETKAESFYRGRIADKIDAFMKEHGGFLRKDDLAAHQPEWVEPLTTTYRGYNVWQIPPNGQGLVVLTALNILEGFDFPMGKDHPDTYHKQMESLKLAFADGHHYIGDPRFVDMDIEGLLSKEYAAERRKLIGETAIDPTPGKPPGGGTVYLCTADDEGNMVSYIQSNYYGFGSGVVIPDMGIAFQDRGFAFNLDKDSVKYVVPGKRPYHTIIPGFMTKDGEAVGPFGVMGGPIQPQAHLMVVSNMVDFHLNPQATLDAPRWQWDGGKKVTVEPSFPQQVAAALVRKGHDIQYSQEDGVFGRGQIICRLPNGTYAAGSEYRTEGYAATW